MGRDSALGTCLAAQKEIPAEEGGRNSINLKPSGVSKWVSTSLLPRYSRSQDRGQWGPVTLNGNPQEPPLCGGQEDTPVEW